MALWQHPLHEAADPDADKRQCKSEQRCCNRSHCDPRPSLLLMRHLALKRLRQIVFVGALSTDASDQRVPWHKTSPLAYGIAKQSRQTSRIVEQFRSSQYAG